MSNVKEKIRLLRIRLQQLDEASSSDDEESSSSFIGTKKDEIVKEIIDKEDNLPSTSSSCSEYNSSPSLEKKKNNSNAVINKAFSDCEATDTTSIMAFHRQKLLANKTNRLNPSIPQQKFYKTSSVDSGKGSSMNPSAMSISMDDVPSVSLSSYSQPNLVQNPPPPHPRQPLQMISTFRKQETLEICGKTYRILNLLGKGGSSTVYHVYDEESKNCFAVKCVDLSDADEIVKKAYANEITLLEDLQHSNRVVKMFAFEFCPEKNILYVVMEKGDTDLATLFKTKKEERLSDVTIAYFWAEMLKAVQVVHSKGIVHSDLKPANFLLVAGHLKLIDFGIANAVPNNKTSVTKESHMGTLNYMSPEAMSNAGGPSEYKFKVGVKSDVWSLGCILYNMVYGRTPFQHIGNPAGKLMAITNPKYLIEFPPISDSALLDVMKKCLQRDSKLRPTIEQLLNHPYVVNKPTSSSSADGPGLSEETFLDLAKIVGKTTPKTGARILKKALSQLQLKRDAQL